MTATAAPVTVSQQEILLAYGAGTDLGVIARKHGMTVAALWDLLGALCSHNAAHARQLARGPAIPDPTPVTRPAPVVAHVERPVPKPTGEPLTAREMVVLRALADRRRHREIAAELHISRSLVSKTCTGVYRKLGTDNAYDALASAKAAGLVAVPPATPREIQILELLAVRCKQKDIARRVGITPWMLRGAIERLYRRLDVHCRADAVAAARRQGLIGGER